MSYLILIYIHKRSIFWTRVRQELNNDDDNNNNNNNLFNLSSFTVSEANYRLTFGYHGIASSFVIYNYIYFIFY
jgi:hypothetical protein